MFGNHRVIDHPFVSTVARELWDQAEFKRFIKDNPDRVRKAAVVGLLLEFFLSPKTTDGNFMAGLTEQKIDQAAGVPGFGKALGMSGLLWKEVFPREGMHAHQLESWFDPKTAELLRALYAWWAEQPAAQVAPPAEAQVEEKEPAARVTRKVSGPLFEAFWSLYPEGSRKVDKPGCRDKYHSLLNGVGREGAKHDDIMEGLGRWLKSQDWLKDGGKFVPQVRTWLNQRRWEARPEPAIPTKDQPEPALSDEEVRRRRQETSDRIAQRRGVNLNGHSDHGG